MIVRGDERAVRAAIGTERNVNVQAHRSSVCRVPQIGTVFMDQLKMCFDGLAPEVVDHLMHFLDAGGDGAGDDDCIIH